MRHRSTLALVALWIGAVLAVPTPALADGWSLPDESRGARVAPLLLLSRPDVRDDLRLDPKQGAEADRAIADLHQKAATLKGQTGPDAVARRRAVDDGQRAWLETHLAVDQVDRLAQIDLRWEGPAAIVTRPAVADALSLSADQKSTLARALADRDARRAKDPEAAERAFEKATAAVLSDGQKGRWAKMVGPPFMARSAVASGHRPKAQ